MCEYLNEQIENNNLDIHNIALLITVGGMRRFACRNFQINTNADSKLSYTPCYV